MFWQAPIVVVALISWLNSPAISFADAAQRETLRRQLMPKPTRQLTNLNLPPSAIITEDTLARSAADQAGGTDAGKDAKPDAAGAKSQTATPDDAKHDQQWWADRMTSARNKLDQDQGLASALQSQINGLTTEFVNRDDPAQRAKIADDRRKALDQFDQMQKQIVEDQKAISAIQDDARKANVPPGWVR